MNYFDKTRVYLFIIIILVIFNISAIVAIIYHHRSERKPEAKEDTRDRGKHLADKLGFDKSQLILFDTLSADFGRKAKMITGSIQEKRLEMMKEFTSETPDTAKLYRLTDEIGSLHAQMRRLSIAHFMSVKKICNPAQKIKLQDIFRGMMQMEEGSGYNHRHGNTMGRKPYVREGVLF